MARNIAKRVKKVIKSFTRSGKMFTALDVSQEVKKKEWFKHSKIAAQVRDIYSNNGFPSEYTMTDISVVTRKGTELARLYHRVSDDPDTYTNREQKASRPQRAPVSRAAALQQTTSAPITSQYSSTTGATQVTPQRARTIRLRRNTQPTTTKEYTVTTDGRVRIGDPVKAAAGLQSNHCRVYFAGNNESIRIVKSDSGVVDDSKYALLSASAAYVELSKKITERLGFKPNDKIKAEVSGRSIVISAA